MKDGIAEHRIEFILEFHFAGVLLAHIQTKRPRGGDEFAAGIDTDGLTAPLPQDPCQLAITASQVQYPFSGARIEEFQRRHAEIAHIASVSRVFLGAPDMWFHAHMEVGAEVRFIFHNGYSSFCILISDGGRFDRFASGNGFYADSACEGSGGTAGGRNQPARPSMVPASPMMSVASARP